MVRWGIVTTIKAPLAEIEAFVAHHLSLGADHITLHLDDPDDPAAHALSGLDRLTIVPCTTAYWTALCGDRPPNQEARQAANMQRAYEASPLDWLAFIDGDEFLWPLKAVEEVLEATPPPQQVVRLRPWEALHTPGMAEDIFTARWFRRPIFASKRPKLHHEIFSPFQDFLPKGVLSHSSGKCFHRTGQEGLVLRLHGAERDGKKVPGGEFEPDIPLLHFHAQDPVRWKGQLIQRLAAGAYRFNAPLSELLGGADAEEIDMFYHHVMAPGPMLVQDWVRRGYALRADLGLRAKVAALRAG